MAEPKHQLDFDGLDLTGRTRYGSGVDWYRFKAHGEGVDLGNAEPMSSEVQTPLFDGSEIEFEKWANRTMTWPLTIEAGNSRGLAAGERDLAGRTGSTPRVLGYAPPDGFGARTEYDVQVSSLSHEYDDLNELSAKRRYYTLHLTCFPFGYAAEEVTTTATTGDDGLATFDLPGSAPAVGTIEVPVATSNSAALLYTSPHLGVGVPGHSGTAYLPHVASSGSGSVNVKRLPPGTYVVMARISHTSSIVGTTVSATLDQSGTTNDEVSMTSAPVKASDVFGSNLAIVPVGLVTLPLLDVVREASSASVSLTTSVGPGSVGQLWLFRLGDGAGLSLVKGSSFVWFSQPVLGDTTPGVFSGGTLATAAFPGASEVLAWGKHRLMPPSASVYYFNGTTHSGVGVKLTHRPAFHHFGTVLS